MSFSLLSPHVHIHSGLISYAQVGSYQGCHRHGNIMEFLDFFTEFGLKLGRVMEKPWKFLIRAKGHEILRCGHEKVFEKLWKVSLQPCICIASVCLVVCD